MVKCADCGFLALVDRDTDEVRELGIRLRTNPYGKSDELGRSPVPTCFVRAHPIHDEIHGEILRLFPILDEEMPGDLSRFVPAKATRIAIGQLTQQERECDSFARWKHGYSPKEHRETLDRQRVREQEDARLETDRRWRTDMRREERLFRVTELVVLGLLVSTATVVAGAVGRGWEPTWWPF